MTKDTVCVHGLGHIGLPTAVVLADSGYRVYGYDTSESVRQTLRTGQIPLEEPNLEELVVSVVDDGRLTPVDDGVAADYHLICVPSPLDEARSAADLTYIESAAGTVASNLESGDTVVVESTVPPGTTAETVAPVLESTGLETDADFDLAYSPETVLPGKILTEIRENDRLVGGVGPDSTAAAVDLYDSFVTGSIHRTTATTAEFAKLAQNTFRDVNIALANEFAKLAADFDIDAREGIRLANTHPRVGIHRPGPGAGGHCLPVDPWFLCQHTDDETLIESARDVNDEMVFHVADLVRSHVGSLSDSRIAVLGLAYKGDVADTRQSPGIRLVENLRARDSGEIRVHDPHADVDGLGFCVPSGDTADATVSTDGGDGTVASVVEGADAVVITTDHTAYKDLSPAAIGQEMRDRVLVDTTGILDETQWRSAGFAVSTI